MRKAWGRWAGIVIGLGGAAATAASAREFPFTVVPLAIPAAPGTASPPIVADNVLLVPSGLAPIPKPSHLSNRALMMQVFDAQHTGVFAAVKNGVRSRGSSMTDVYLHGTHGFHLSAGSSYRVDYVAPDYGPSAAAGTAALMKMPVGMVNFRDGYDSYAPVAMVGYDHPLTDRLRVGIEGGAMRGRAAAMYPVDSMPSDIPPDHAGINPVGDLVMTYLF